MTVSLLPILDRNFHLLTDEYRTLAIAKADCKACEIHSHYSNMPVQSEGNSSNPNFMIIGEAPGRDECQQCRPFIGKAGKELRDQLRKRSTTFNRSTTLISNVLGCRPLDNQFPKDKSIPSGCAQRWLFKEIEIVRPRILVTLGNPASEFVRGESGITKIRGTWKLIDKFGLWCFSTFHPSYVIRSSTDKSIQRLWKSDWDSLASEWASKA